MKLKWKYSKFKSNFKMNNFNKIFFIISFCLLISGQNTEHLSIYTVGKTTIFNK